MSEQTGKPAKRVVHEFVQSIPAARCTIFPLLCPERETEWLDGWDYRMTYSASGYAEEGCVFTTREGDRETVWVITHHDPDAGVVRFARITCDIAATTLDVRVEQVDPVRSRVHIRYTHTSLSAAGDTFLDTITAEIFNERMRFWEASMTYYLEHGKKLSHAQYAGNRNGGRGISHHPGHRR